MLKNMLAVFTIVISFMFAVPGLADEPSLPDKKVTAAFAKASLKEMMPFSNLSGGIKINYPKNWEIGDKLGDPIVAKFSGLNGLVSVRVTSEGVPFNTRVEDFATATNAAIKQAMTAQSMPITEISENKIELPLGSAIENVYSYKLADAPAPATVMQVVAVKKDRGYVFNFTAHSKYFDQFRKVAETMVKSLDLL